jgi:hypothetical protein
MEALYAHTESGQWVIRLFAHGASWDLTYRMLLYHSNLHLRRVVVADSSDVLLVSWQ